MSGHLRELLNPLLLLGILLFAGCQSPTTSPPAKTLGPPLPQLMAERLGMAREVAWTKHHSGAPVLDPEREAAAELAPAAENLLASEGFSPAVIALAVAPLRR